jgi:hypothetical protein
VHVQLSTFAGHVRSPLDGSLEARAVILPRSSSTQGRGHMGGDRDGTSRVVVGS